MAGPWLAHEGVKGVRCEGGKGGAWQGRGWLTSERRRRGAPLAMLVDESLEHSTERHRPRGAAARPVGRLSKHLDELVDRTVGLEAKPLAELLVKLDLLGLAHL